MQKKKEPYLIFMQNFVCEAIPEKRQWDFNSFIEC